MLKFINILFLITISCYKAHGIDKPMEDHQKTKETTPTPSAPLIETNEELRYSNTYHLPYDKSGSLNILEPTPYNGWQVIPDYVSPGQIQTLSMKSESEKLLEEIQELKEQNKLLLQLTTLNQEQLKTISEALGINFEKSEKNQEQMQVAIESIKSKMSSIKKSIENGQSGTLYVAYQCLQNGLQLSKAVGYSVATYKILSIAPAFVIPGWIVYLSTIGAGAAVYFLKL